MTLSNTLSTSLTHFYKVGRYDTLSNTLSNTLTHFYKVGRCDSLQHLYLTYTRITHPLLLIWYAFKPTRSV